MKVTLITTVFNEENTITKFLDSISAQSRLPDEIIIVDGGSKDKTVSIISNFKFQISNKTSPKIKILIKKGNRSVGRNEAIKTATNQILAISDAGCVLDRNWLKNLLIPFERQGAEVVAGFYKGLPGNIFQKSLIPYVLVMEDRIDSDNFLPATRSMALTKSIWEKAGKFNEKLSHNEDYAFANKLKEIRAKIVFRKDAFVNWLPRKNIIEAFVMFFRFALGDSQSYILRDKVIYIFLRYFFAVYLLLLGFILKSILFWGLYAVCVGLYIVWSALKNYKYVRDVKAFLYLPLLQITSDVAVISGTLLGLTGNLSFKNLKRILFSNKSITSLVLFYVVIMLGIINWGIPNLSHPFSYHMDEWHQLQAVRDLFKYGTPNIAGAANGTIFHFFLAGLYLIPFYLLGIINPFAIKSSVLDLDLQQRLFEVLRTNTLLFGAMSIILIYYFAKKYFKLNGFIVAFLFVVNPLWLMLSNYFKYDISLTFWIMLAFLFLLRYINNPKTVNFILAGLFSGLAFSVKVSAIPLLPLCILSFFLYTPDFLKKLKTFSAGLLFYFLTITFFGFPDLIFGKGSLTEYLKSNLIDVPNALNNNYNFGMSIWQYFFTRIYPIDFGKPLYLLFYISIFFLSILFMRYLVRYGLRQFIKIHRNYLFLLMFLICFMTSLYPLGIGAIGNRVLVLLPFLAISTGIFLSKVISMRNKFVKTVVLLAVVILLIVQAIETFSYFKLKLSPDIRSISSGWIVENIKPHSLIGLENIPIYQGIPDVILRDFYLQQYGIKADYLYRYRIVGAKVSLPKIIIITNANIESQFVVNSDKNKLIKTLMQNDYRVLKQFKSNFEQFPKLQDRFDLSFSGLIPISDSITILGK